jgi:hypothetical protein
MILACWGFGLLELFWYVFGTPLTWIGAGLGGYVVLWIWVDVYETKRVLRQRARTRGDVCLRCGYDLRATPRPVGPTLPRCLECGTECTRSIAPSHNPRPGEAAHRPDRSRSITLPAGSRRACL